MLRKIIFLFICTLYFVFCTSTVGASGEFSVDSTVTYKVQDNGRTLVTHDITLENNLSTLYATSYTLSLENIGVENVTSKLDTVINKDGDKTIIKVLFKDAVVGKGSQRHFFITYENTSFAVRTGEVWEVSIPRVSDKNDYRNYNLNLVIPDSLGLEAYISPRPKTALDSGGFKNYTFDNSELDKTGITAGFGQFQVFSFDLSYHLENPLSRNGVTEIALPPDTAYQKVYIQNIDPKPTNVKIDSDGNWLAVYNLTPRQRIDVKVVGSVQLFASFRIFPKPTQDVLQNNLKETLYWQINDPSIKTLAQKLKTPKAIYDYVVSTLKYDFTKVQPNTQRMGALEAFKNPTQAICMEFTDLFIALSRAAGIPAREVNGFAYTENKDLQPLGLVADVLHAWPEYYDQDKHVWIPIDPTWGSTTGGEDFFNKLDLRHFAFVVHGEDSNKPYAPGSYKLGPNPQKDVFVSFGKLPENRISHPTITLVSKTSLPFMTSKYLFKIENPGPAALYSLNPVIYFDNNLKDKSLIEVLPPYSNDELEVTVPFSLLGKNTPNIIKVTLMDAQIEVPTNKNLIIIYSMVGIFVLFLAIITLVVKKYLKKSS